MSARRATCGCCAGVARAHAARRSQNRPGAARRSPTASATHADFLAPHARRRSPTPSRPRLGRRSTTRDRDDFTIALLDAWAVVARRARPSTPSGSRRSRTSRTARERISLQELGRLIGYRLRPGVAAETHLAFALEPPPAVPAGGVARPGLGAARDAGGRDARAGPARAEHPRPRRAAADVRDGRGDRGAAGVERDARRRRRSPSCPALGDTHAYLAGAALNLQAGRRASCSGGARRARRALGPAAS